MTTLTFEQVLLSHGYLNIQTSADIVDLKSLVTRPEVVTVASNFHYYGFIPSLDSLKRLMSLTKVELATFWQKTEAALRELTADNRRMDDFVVYKNFPKEVLEMSQVQYWGQQILMYWGLDKEVFAQTPTARQVLTEKTNFKVLHLSDDQTASKIYHSLTQNRARWSMDQLAHFQFLAGVLNIQSLEMNKFGFRENGIRAINHLLNTVTAADVKVDDAVDVLRLAALRSDGDVALRQPVKFKSFSRKERRFLCQLLENTKHLENDLAERPELWKRLLQRLHPGDFKVAKVSAAYDRLYQGDLKSFASQVEAGIRSENPQVLNLLGKRPGDFTRRFHKLYETFGPQAVSSYTAVMDKLTNQQLVKFVKYAETISDRDTLVYPPKGNWSRLQIAENAKVSLKDETIAELRFRASGIIRDRLRKLIPDGVELDPRTSLIKLQTNDQELASYGRGTVFEIPQNIKFFRTASYWENDPKQGTKWFDNGWNFFNEKWGYLGATCWNANSYPALPYDQWRNHSVNSNVGAIFSGDPVNAKELKGRACQMIDLYPEKLKQSGVRYAVWNILSYSRVPFDKVTGEVVASLQWGENPETGKLYEPGRAQLIFPLKGASLTKYIAFIDLEKNQLVYMDANLKGTVSSADRNGESLAKQMPAFLEYLNSLPSIADLLVHADKGSVPVLYSDKDRELKNSQLAYVFRPENQTNSFKALGLEKLLS